MVDPDSLRLRKVSVVYGDFPVLEGVDLSVFRGKATGIAGPSGSGKSTLLRIAAHVEAPHAGEVSLGPKSLRSPTDNAKIDPANPWPNITVVFQQFHLWPHLTIKENVELPLYFNRRSSREHVLGLCRRLGLMNGLDKFPREVSVGLRQRAAIARGAVLRPLFFLLDDVTTAQDRGHVASVSALLRQMKSEGTGILVVSNDFEFLEQFADEVFLLEIHRRTLVPTPRFPRIDRSGLNDSGQ